MIGYDDNDGSGGDGDGDDDDDSGDDDDANTNAQQNTAYPYYAALKQKGTKQESP